MPDAANSGAPASGSPPTVSATARPVNKSDWPSFGGAEAQRLEADAKRTANWKRWGPYLSERQWGTVREDYSADGDCWAYFPHDHARSRAYRWGEDGILGICDRECRLCFALAMWNGKDPILKERLFGLTGPEGNCGEDVKENYYFLESTPTHSYMKALYKYPQREYPYARLLDESRKRSRAQGEFELCDAGVFDQSRYYDVFAEYAKDGPDDILIRVTIHNRGPEAQTLHLLPHLWFRNTWSWGKTHEEVTAKPILKKTGPSTVLAQHETLGEFTLTAGAASIAGAKESRQPLSILFTENDTNLPRLYGYRGAGPFVKDAFHEYIIHGVKESVNTKNEGTKCAMHYRLDIPAGASATLKLRLARKVPADALGPAFDASFQKRREECDDFYARALPKSLPDERRAVARQAYAGMLWSKQFYYYVVEEWLRGDPAQPPPPAQRLEGRNHDWQHLFNRDVISMPDSWEYPWYAAWDLAFHTIVLAQVDPGFAKEQLLLFLREWYMHPNGQLPAYEFALGDVNPPVHAWACWRVYKITAPPGERDVDFLERAFQKLMISFTWWVNRKDPEGKNIFAGGFLGLDNIGVFDRSRPLPTGGNLEQADGTAWIAFYCHTMLAMALELARTRPAYEDIASKFFEHFISIADAINSLGGAGLWDEQDGFYYDQLSLKGAHIPLRLRSLVGVMPAIAVETIDEDLIAALPAFAKRTEWFLRHRPDLADYTAFMEKSHGGKPRHLVAIPTKDRLLRVLKYVLDENEFFSPFGVRSLSRIYKDHPYVFRHEDQEYRVDYCPGESNTSLFGGNSNWRGPIWFPLNYLLVEALERYHRFYGDSLTIECPTGSGKQCNLAQVADQLRDRLCSLFIPDPLTHMRPCHGNELLYANDPAWKDLVLFYEYFHGETGRGLGAAHQTGWTGLVGPLLADPYWRIDKENEGK